MKNLAVIFSVLLSILSGLLPAFAAAPNMPLTSDFVYSMKLGNDFFLSATNPIATSDQRDLEFLALKVLQMPQVQTAKQQAAKKWIAIFGQKNISDEAMTRFDELVDEWAFNYVMRSVNSDPNYPRALGALYQPAHKWFGMNVPGSRGAGGDNPDNHYTVIPMDEYGHYQVTGKRLAPAIGDVSFSLLGPITVTLAYLDGKDIQYNEDGTFVITLGPEPAKGRPNYIQTTLDADHLLIRDSRSDWRQKPNAYRVKRLNPPLAAPITVEQMADRAARYMIQEIPDFYFWVRIFDGLDVNTVGPTIAMGNSGGMVSQQLNWTRLTLKDDEAFVMTVADGGATYRNFVLQDTWFRTLDYWQHTSNMNNTQSVAQADGSTTYVISIEDPGVHNWLDPMGLHDLLVLHRWQGLPRGAKPWIKGQLVKFNELNKILPLDIKRVTEQARKQQLAERLETYNLRWVDQ